MNTNLNEAVTKLKLSETNYSPNLNDVLNKLKTKEANYHRSKVISISKALLGNPYDALSQAQLKVSLERLNGLQTAS